MESKSERESNVVVARIVSFEVEDDVHVCFLVFQHVHVLCLWRAHKLSSSGKHSEA